MTDPYQQFLGLKTERDRLVGELESARSKREQGAEKLERLTKSRWVITQVIQLTQRRFRNRVESIVTLAIKPVFGGRDFEFQLKPMETARHRTEYKPIVTEGGIEWIPEDDLGYSIFDVSGVSCRIGFWSLEEEKTRPFFVLDEPMTNVGSGEELITSGRMLMAISKELGIQMLIITHEDELAEIADIAYRVTQKGGKSTVEQTKGKVLRRVR